MKRWCYVLSCGHSLLADGPALIGDHDFCRGCGMTFEIRDVYVYRDGDACA